MKDIGINPDGVRFRQHLAGEMAHYAKDCWDCEILTSYGWTEMVGLADRSAFDLNNHSRGSKKPLVASRILKEPRKEKHLIIDFDKGKIGKQYSKQAKNVQIHFDEMTMENKYKFRAIIDAGEAYKFSDCSEQEYLIDKSVVKGFKEKDVNITEEKYTPWVIEPAFGIGRI